MADSELAFELAWLVGIADAPVERATFASLAITVGEIPITEVDDRIAQTVRRDIRVPTLPLAKWLIVNWWRLRWEPRPEAITPPWLRAHCMAAVSTDVPWPAFNITSDGAFVSLEARAERIRDVSAVRYLRDVDVSVPAHQFESAVDGFLAQLDARIASCVPDDDDFKLLIAELRDERSNPKLARICRLQAIAGFDPGTAPSEWIRAAEQLADEAGEATGDEIIAAVPLLRDGVDGARAALEAMKRSRVEVRIPNGINAGHKATTELPWQHGRRMANAFRTVHQIGDGPLPTSTLEQLLETSLPLPVSPAIADRRLSGGYRDRDPRARTRIVVTTDRPDNQRFYLGRLIAAALLAPASDNVLPITNAATAFQKFERSFAQELLCPWQALDDFTNDSGLDDDGISSAAEHFIVSEHLILSTLVNNGKLSRDRLPYT
jgi:hypothetical protein